MIMKKRFAVAVSVTLLRLCLSAASAADALKPDPAGYIRD